MYKKYHEEICSQFLRKKAPAPRDRYGGERVRWLLLESVAVHVGVEVLRELGVEVRRPDPVALHHHGGRSVLLLGDLPHDDPTLLLDLGVGAGERHPGTQTVGRGFDLTRLDRRRLGDGLLELRLGVLLARLVHRDVDEGGV